MHLGSWFWSYSIVEYKVLGNPYANTCTDTLACMGCVNTNTRAWGPGLLSCSMGSMSWKTTPVNEHLMCIHTVLSGAKRFSCLWAGWFLAFPCQCSLASVRKASLACVECCIGSTLPDKGEVWKYAIEHSKALQCGSSAADVCQPIVQCEKW